MNKLFNKIRGGYKEMYVYSLNNKDNPSKPFYIGITKDIEQRYKQHKQKYTAHKPYITNPNDFFIHPILNTGDNEYSIILAEKLETNLIKYYDTVNNGSNKVYDVRKYFKEQMNMDIRYNITTASKEKSKKTRIMNKHKKFKKVIKLIKDDPFNYSVNDIALKTNLSIGTLNNYTKKYHNTTFNQWLKTYQTLWMNRIMKYINN